MNDHPSIEPAHDPRPWFLSERERRVLGVLIEKGLTTPEYYPLTLKALVAGCNQKSNRDPVTRYDEEEVEGALESLRSRNLVANVMASTGRAERWRQELGRALELSATQLGVLGGPETLDHVLVRRLAQGIQLLGTA